MWALENVNEVSVEQIPDLTFQIPGRQFIPVSHRSGKVSCKFELEGVKRIRKAEWCLRVTKLSSWAYVGLRM